MEKIKDVVKEILDKNSKIIIISGNYDPTYSSSEFSYTLIDYNKFKYVIERDDSARGGHKKQKLDISTKKWLTKVLNELQDIYDLFIIKNNNSKFPNNLFAFVWKPITAKNTEELYDKNENSFGQIEIYNME